MQSIYLTLRLKYILFHYEPRKKILLIRMLLEGVLNLLFLKNSDFFLKSLV